MAVVAGFYLACLAGSIAFFLWSAYSYALSRRTAIRRQQITIGPDTSPAIVALYCQHLLAPQMALQEARQSLRLVLPSRNSDVSSDDFLAILAQLEGQSHAAAH